MSADQRERGSSRPLVIGIVGGSGSGKTTVARAIHDAPGVDAAIIDHDAYYHDLAHMALAERKRVNFDHPDSLDNALLAVHVRDLVAGRAIEKPTYDFAQHTRAHDTITVTPREVIIVEGILLFNDPRVRELFDIKLFVDVADDIRFIRRLLRDVQDRGRAMGDVIRQYLETVRPMHLEFVEPSKRWADVIIPEGGHNMIGIEMVIARVQLDLQLRKTT